MKKKFNREGGFTLLEVIVAFSIVSISLTVIYQLFESSIKHQISLEKYQRAVAVAESTLTDLNVKYDLSPGTIEGDFDADYQWKSIVTPFDDSIDVSEGNSKLFKVKHEISWLDKGKIRTLEVDTLRLSHD